MKKLVSYILIVWFIGGVFFLNSCKRGENDPFFSFRSRKQRVTGYWDINTVDKKTTTINKDGEKIIETFTISGENAKLITQTVNTPADTIITVSGKVKEAFYRFDKDGRMDYVFRYELVDNYAETDENTSFTTIERTITNYEYRGNGTWNFLAGMDNYSNKERLSLVFESLNHKKTINYYINVFNDDGESQPGFPQWQNNVIVEEAKYANGEFAQVWVIDMLKAKETDLKRQIDNLDLFQTTEGEGTQSSISVKGDEFVGLKQK